MVKILEVPLTMRVTNHPENNKTGGITKYRNKNVDSASWGRVAATHAMYMGATALAVAELVLRVALATLAFIPMMFVPKTQKAWGENFALPIVMLTGILAGLPMAMVDNVAAKIRKSHNEVLPPFQYATQSN